MHSNYYFLKKLSVSLDARLNKAIISECFSQNKNELIIRFETEGGSFYIKASLQPAFCCLSFSDDFNRARKNSVDLFQETIGLQVQSVRQFKNDRSFALVLNEGYALVFKMHGNKANVILFHEDAIRRLFKSKLKRDLSHSLHTLDREIDWSFEQFENHQHDLKKQYFTLGEVVWQHLEENNFYNKSIHDKWNQFQQVIQKLEDPTLYIMDRHGLPQLSLLPGGHIIQTLTDPIEAVNTFASRYNALSAFKNEMEKAGTWLQAKIANTKSYIDKTNQKLQEIKQDIHYKLWADLIMANLHAIPTGASSVSLQNFYNGQDEDVKLKADLTPQKNAALYYKKSKNQSIQLEFLEQSLKNKKEEQQRFTDIVDQINDTKDIKTLRLLTKDLQMTPVQSEETKPNPFHEFEYKGYRIWVGKNAISNDQLTLKYTYKEDLWLHAKDVSGSHVVIKYQSGKIFPKDVIERAAQLAAYNSKRKTESLCPVIYTPKKFVRKRKGDPAGAVVVEKENVIMVEPIL